MSDKLLKRCSIALVIREMWTQTTIRYHFTPTNKAAFKELQNNRVGENVEKLELSSITSGDTKYCIYSKQEFGKILNKLNLEF